MAERKSFLLRIDPELWADRITSYNVCYTKLLRFLLRIDPELWADLELWAKDELRSVNGQIEYLLKQAVLRRKGRAQLEQGARLTEEGTGLSGEGQGKSYNFV